MVKFSNVFSFGYMLNSLKKATTYLVKVLIMSECLINAMATCEKQQQKKESNYIEPQMHIDS